MRYSREQFDISDQTVPDVDPKHDEIDADYDIGVTADDSSEDDIEDNFIGDDTVPESEEVPDVGAGDREEPWRQPEGKVTDPQAARPQPRKEPREAAHDTPRPRPHPQPRPARADHAEPRQETHSFVFTATDAPTRTDGTAVMIRPEEAPDRHREHKLSAENVRTVEYSATGEPKTLGEAIGRDEDPQKNMIGGNDIDREVTTYYAVIHDLHKIRNDQVEGRRATDASFVVADFNPTPGDSFFMQGAHPDVYDAEETTVVEKDGLLSRLYAEELTDTLARAAAGEDDAARRAFARILDPLTQALGEDYYDAATREQHILAPDIDKLNLALQQARGFERGRLDAGEEALVDRALPKPFKEQNAAAMEQIGILVEDLAASARMTRNNSHGRIPQGVGRLGAEVPRMKVETLAVTDAGDAQGNILAHGLLHYVRATRPDGVVLKDADFGDPVALHKLLRECRKLGAKVYVAVESVQDENVQKLVQRGATTVMKLAPGDAGIVSNLLGTTDGEEVQSESINYGGSEGGSNNQSVQEGFEGESPEVKTKGTSGSVDDNRSFQVGVTQNVQYGDIPVARAGHLRLIGEGQAAVFGSGGQRRGRWDTNSTTFIDEFPPPGRKRINVDKHLARIAAMQGVEIPAPDEYQALPPADIKGALTAGPAVNGAKDASGMNGAPKPVAATGSEQLRQPTVPSRSAQEIQMPRLASSDPLTSITRADGRLMRLRMQFGLEDSYGLFRQGTSRAFKRHLAEEAQARNMTEEDFMRWIGLNR